MDNEPDSDEETPEFSIELVESNSSISFDSNSITCDNDIVPESEIYAESAVVETDSDKPEVSRVTEPDKTGSCKEEILENQAEVIVDREPGVQHLEDGNQISDNLDIPKSEDHVKIDIESNLSEKGVSENVEEFDDVPLDEKNTLDTSPKRIDYTSEVTENLEQDLLSTKLHQDPQEQSKLDQTSDNNGAKLTSDCIDNDRKVDCSSIDCNLPSNEVESSVENTEHRSIENLTIQDPNRSEGPAINSTGKDSETELLIEKETNQHEINTEDLGAKIDSIEGEEQNQSGVEHEIVGLKNEEHKQDDKQIIASDHVQISDESCENQDSQIVSNNNDEQNVIVDFNLKVAEKMLDEPQIDPGKPNDIDLKPACSQSSVDVEHGSLNDNVILPKVDNIEIQEPSQDMSTICSVKNDATYENSNRVENDLLSTVEGANIKLDSDLVQVQSDLSMFTVGALNSVEEKVPNNECDQTVRINYNQGLNEIDENSGTSNSGKVNVEKEILPLVNKQQMVIPETNTGLDTENVRDETTPVPLGSPDIQINSDLSEDDLKDLDNDKEPEGANLVEGTEQDLISDDENMGSTTPKACSYDNLLDSNCLGHYLSAINTNLDDSEEDLEAEFNNEPPFIRRNVSIKRFVDPKSEYDFGDELGRGKFGTVYRVHHKLDGLELAAKIIMIRRKEDLMDVEREVGIMSTLQHPRLVQLYDAFIDCPTNSPNETSQICLVTELIEGGELFERIVDDDFDLTEKKAAIFMRQICEGVEYMHNMGVVHLDMKPENILCVSKTSNRIKLIDFGLARKLEPNQSLRVMFGTPDFAAPEVLSYDVVTYATDMWSVGVICYVLLSGLSPFMGDSDIETMANVQRATYDFDSDAFDPITDLAKDFISRLLVMNPNERLKPRECLEHPWLQKGGHLLEVAVRSRRESMVSIMSFRSDNNDSTNMIGLNGFASLTSLNKRNLKKYVIRRKWHRTVNAIMALGRMGANLKQKFIGQ